MKIFLDEGVPEPLASYLTGHDVHSVRSVGLKGTKNGKLLKAVEDAGFDAFITNDKKMEAEQRLVRRPFAVLILSASNLPVILPYIDVIQAAVEASRPGQVQHVECGRFVAHKR